MDIANHTLVEICGIKACIWNLIHVVIYFSFCILVDAKFSIKKHTFVFMVGFLWYKLSPFAINSNSNKCQNNIVYKDTNKPRGDDIIFNITGQLLYLIYSRILIY
jgi:hypothetical protein